MPAFTAFLFIDVGLSAAASVFITNVIISIAISELISAAEKALTPGAKSGKGQGLEINYFDTESSLVVLFGSLRVGGMETIPPVTSGASGEHLTKVLTVAGHQVSGYFEAYANDVVIYTNTIAPITGATNDGKVTTPAFMSGSNERMWLRCYDGSQTTVDWKLSNEVDSGGFPASFVGHEMAYIAAQFQFDPQLFPGVPTITRVTRGALVYDPRQDSTNGGFGTQRYATPSTWRWDENPALCLANFLMSDYGGDYDPTEINWTDVTNAANACDAQVVSVPPDSGYTLAGAGMTQTGDTLYKSGGADDPTFACCAIGTTGIIYGSVSVVLYQGLGVQLFGLHSSPVVASPRTLMGYGFGIDASANLTIIEHGTTSLVTGLVATLTTVFRIDYDATFLRFFVDNTLVFTGPVLTPGQRLYFMSAVETPDIGITVGRQKRWTMNARVLANDDFVGNLKQLTASMLGRLLYANGQWRMFAGGWSAPLYTINESDWVSNLTFQFDGGRAVRFNRARVWFVDPNQNWQRVEAYPRNSTTYYAADGNEWIDLQTDQPYCTVENEAQRDGEFVLRASRNQVSVSGRLPPRWQRLQLWDTVSINHAMLGWAGKTFRCTQCTINTDSSVDVVFKEEQSTDWTDLAASEYNNPSKIPLPAVNPAYPSAPTALSGVRQINGTIDFTIGTPVTVPHNTRYRLFGSAFNSFSVSTTVWDGTGLIAPRINAANSQNYYWVEAYINPSSPSAIYPPPGSSGYPQTAIQYDTGQIQQNAATTTFLGGYPSPINGLVNSGNSFFTSFNVNPPNYDCIVIITAMMNNIYVDSHSGNCSAEIAYLEPLAGVASYSPQSAALQRLGSGGASVLSAPNVALQWQFNHSAANSSASVALGITASNSGFNVSLQSLVLQAEYITR